MTLTYQLDLDILPLYLHAKIQVSMSVRLAGIARRTDTYTDTQCKSYYTHHIRNVWCKNQIDDGASHLMYMQYCIYATGNFPENTI